MSKPHERILDIAVQHAAGRPLAEQTQILTDCLIYITDPEAHRALESTLARLQAANQLLKTFTHEEYADQASR